MKIYIRILILFFVILQPVLSQNKNLNRTENTSIIKLENNSSQLSFELNGGALIDFQLKSTNLNPFTWKLTSGQMPKNNQSGAAFQGHFLCVGRWGSPTNGEIKAGVPHNGQSSRDSWKIDSTKTTNFLKMSFTSPMDGIQIERDVKLDNTNSIFKVKERFKNTNTIGRLFNVVQHATIGTPFLDSTVIVSTNAKEGFMQSLSFPNPSAFEYEWPIGYTDSLKTVVDLSKSDSRTSYVSTHIFSDSIGWVTIANPQKGVLMGYIWKTVSYPWINIWHQLIDGKLWAKGLEFGTTGIGRSYQDLLSCDTRFHGRNSFFFLDATETVEKEYICFQIQISKSFQQVEKLELTPLGIKITEKEISKPMYLFVKTDIKFN